MVSNLHVESDSSLKTSLWIWRTVLVLGGMLWGGWYFGMGLIGWGAPGSSRYERYELYNRIAPAVLLLLLAGIQGAHRILHKRYNQWGNIGYYIISLGLIVMILGSGLEFWVFSETSYDSHSLRHWGWGTYCSGLLIFYIGTAIFGAVLTKLKRLQTTGLLFLIWLPAGAISGGLGTLIGVMVPGLSLAVALCGIGYMLLGLCLDER